MSNENDGFESVGDSNPMWNPRQTGSSKTNDYVELKADDKSWATGYYLGCKTGIGENNATVHTIKMSGVGNKAHINGTVDPSTLKVDLWGSNVLDGKIAENIMPGMMIRIVWQGLQAPKKAGGKNYHGWDLQVNNTVEPMVVAASTMPTQAPNTNPVGNTDPAPAAAATDAAEDDDLPF
jgi:hypothetical protein